MSACSPQWVLSPASVFQVVLVSPWRSDPEGPRCRVGLDIWCTPAWLFIKDRNVHVKTLEILSCFYPETWTSLNKYIIWRSHTHRDEGYFLLCVSSVSSRSCRLLLLISSSSFSSVSVSSDNSLWSSWNLATDAPSIRLPLNHKHTHTVSPHIQMSNLFQNRFIIMRLIICICLATLA